MQDQTNSTSELFKKAVAFTVTITALGNARRAPIDTVTVNADKELLRLSKKLIESELFDKIREHDGATRKWIESRSLPSFFKKAVLLIPLALIEEVEAYLEKRNTERQKLVEAFLAEYPAKVEEAKQRLRDLFNPSDYKSIEAAKQAFSMTWNYVVFTTPENLPKSIFERERAKLESTWNEAQESLRDVLRVQMKELVEHMFDRLQPGEDGKPKIFKNTMVSNMTDFLATFDAKNLTEDTKLADLVCKAKQALQGIQPEELRKNDDTREVIRQKFAELKAKLDSMVIEKPTRRFDLEEAA